MLQGLSNNFVKILDKIRGKSIISEADLNETMREIRIALLEADVALEVVKKFINNVKEHAIGKEVYKNISPGQMIIKIISDELTSILGIDSEADINLSVAPPAVILMLGLQGSGKTTSSGKLAKYLTENLNKRVLLASLDVARPAAFEQLKTLAAQISVDILERHPGDTPLTIADKAKDFAKKGSYDVLILDSAGRLHIDEDLVSELKNIASVMNPIEKIMVLDSLTGQDALAVAKKFNEAVGITSSIFTRVDGDARGGAMLSFAHSLKLPIKFVGVGEKLSEFERFSASRIADRILDKGDIVSLVEKAASVIDAKEAEKMAKKMQKGIFTLNEYLSQLKTMKKMGGLSSIMGFMPGMNKIKNMMEENPIDEKIFLRQEAIILSMTMKERLDPKILGASRKKRIASGSGVRVEEVNKLLKQFADMQRMMKQFQKLSKNGNFASNARRLFS